MNKKVTLTCDVCGAVVTGTGRTVKAAQMDATFNLKEHQDEQHPETVVAATSQPEKSS